jgi:hypothetical protein
MYIVKELNEMYIVKKIYEFNFKDVCSFDDLHCCVSYIMHQKDWDSGYVIYDTKYGIYLTLRS